MLSILRLIRFPLVFTAIADSLAGYLVTDDSIESTPMIAAGLISFFVYSLGMVLNDIADMERDRTLHPDRPLVTGRVSLAAAWGLVSFFFAGAVITACWIGGATPIVTGGLLATVFGYDLLLKKWTVLGGFAMGAARGLNVLVGVAVAHPGAMVFPWHWYAVVLGCYVTAITCISLLEEKPSRGLLLAYAVVAAASTTPVAYLGWLEGQRAATAFAAAVAVGVLYVALVAIRSLVRSRVTQVVLFGLFLIIPLDAALILTRPDRGAAASWVLALLPLAYGSFLWLNRPKPAKTAS